MDDTMQAPDRLNGHTPPDPTDITFRPGKGGQLTPEWAAWMLNKWWAAGNGKLTFAETIKDAAVHFMVEDQP